MDIKAIKAAAKAAALETRKKQAQDVTVTSKRSKDETSQIKSWFGALASGDRSSLNSIDKEIEADLRQKGQTIGTNADGGFLVPTPLHAEIVRKMYETSSIRPFANVITMDAPTLKVNTENAAPTVQYVGEEVSITESKQTYANDTLTAFKFAGRTGFSNESLLAAASNPSIQNHVVDQFARAMTRFEDAAFIAGAGGGSAIEGIESFTPGTDTNLTAAMTANDLVNFWYSLDKNYRDNAVFLMNDTDRKAVHLLKDSNGRYYWSDGGGFENNGPTLFNRPVIVSNHVTADTIHLIDLSYYMIGDYDQLRVSYGTNADDFAKDRTSVRMTKHSGGLLTNTAAYATLSDVNGSSS